MRRKIEIINNNNELGLSLDIETHNMVDLTWDVLHDLEMFTPEELDLVTILNGYCVKTLNDILYIRYGYRDIEQFLESEYNINFEEEGDHE